MGARITSVITTPAESYDLTTLDAMKLQLNVSDTALDAYLEDRISRVSAAIQKYCNNPFVVEGRTDTIYLERGPYPWQVPGGANYLQLARWPIISVASVVTTAQIAQPITLVQGTDFLVNQDTGQLIRLVAQTGYTSCWDTIPTVVEYTAGYATVPLDVEDACQRMVEKAYWARGRDPSVIETNQPGMAGSQRFWVSTGANGNMPPEVQDILDAYRVPVIG
jgi:hypothetical protein